MFSHVISSISSGIKKTVVPTIISAGRMISAIGESLFSLPKFIKYLTGQNDHPYNLYSSIGVIVSSAIVNVSTRVPAIFMHFRSKEDAPSVNDPTELPFVSDDESFAEVGASNNGYTFCCETELGYKGMSIFIILKTLNIAAIPFTFLSSYLNAITFIEFIAKNGFQKDAHEDILEYITQSASLALAVCGSATYAIYSLKKANHNAKKFAAMVEKNNFTCDKATLSTIAIMTLGTTTVPFLAYFSASNALQKLPLIILPEKVRYVTAGIGALTRTATTLLTQTSSLNSVLTTQSKTVQYTFTPIWERPLKAIVYIAGVGELAATGIANFTGFVNTSHDVFGIDEKNPGLIAIGAVTGSVNATLYFFFSVHEGIKQTIRNAKQRNPSYLALSQDDNDEALLNPISDDEELLSYSKSSSIRFFKENERASHAIQETNRLDNGYSL